jgi:uncharacterized protein YciI
MTKQHYFLKLNPPRSTFMSDMTEEERGVMHHHIAYWKPYVENGTMLIMGPVSDPAGGYGVGIIAVDSKEQLLELLRNDPANGLNKYDYYPMRAVTKL